METRANYVLIGLCTLVGILLGLGFVVWLAKWQSDQQYAYYDVLFDNVSGLSRAAEVRFSGLPVGQVQSLNLAHNGKGQVRVRIEVDAATPIREGATAQLQAQGVTGLSFVSIAPGDVPNMPLLRDTVDGIPEIPGERSVVQSLAEDAPDLLQESIKLIREFQVIVGTENQQKVTGILQNVETASGNLTQAMTDFSSISKTVADATGQISTFTAKLDPIATSVDSALGEAEKTLTAMTGAFNQAGTTLGTADGTLKSVGGAVDGVTTLINTDGMAAVAELKATIEDLRVQVAAIGTEAKTVLSGYGETATLANARLAELETTLSGLDTAISGATTTMASVDGAATSVTTLLDGDGKALVAEARTTLATADRSLAAIEQAATQDLPAVISDVRRALVNVNSTIDTVSGDVTAFTGDLKPLIGTATATLDSATRTFADASTTLERLEPAIAAAEKTMAAAEGTFTTAERIISEDVAPTTASVRESAEHLNAAIDQVASDLPAVTGELKTTLARATDTVVRIDTMVANSSGPVTDFTTQGLPQFVRFTQEARELITRLDRIAAQLERDPARFFLGAQAPDFRR